MKRFLPRINDIRTLAECAEKRGTMVFVKLEEFGSAANRRRVGGVDCVRIELAEGFSRVRWADSVRTGQIRSDASSRLFGETLCLPAIKIKT